MTTRAKNCVLRPYLDSAHWIQWETTVLVTDTFCVLTSLFHLLFDRYPTLKTSLFSTTTAVYFRYTQKKSGFLNTYKTLVYAVPYLKILSAAQNYSMANRQCVKYNLRFYCCPCFWENLHSLLNHPLITLSYWPLVSITLTKLLQLSNWYLRQYSSMSNRVIHSKETNIIFKMTMFYAEEDTNTFQVPNEWSERKS